MGISMTFVYDNLIYPFNLLKSMTGLECGHRFCKQCWVEYLTTKIMEEGLCKSIACAAHGCGKIS